MPGGFGFDAGDGEGKGGSKKGSKSGSKSKVVSTQPGGLNLANAGVKFGLELTKATSTESSVKGEKTRETTSTEEVRGFSAVIREGFNKGHIVEIRKKRQEEGMFGSFSLPSCCGSSEEAGNMASGKGYTSYVFSSKDIEYVEVVETTSEEASMAGGANACGCCGTEETEASLVSKKAVKIYLSNRTTPISIDWDDVLTQTDDEPETCCAPGMRRSYKTDRSTHADGTGITTYSGSEKTALPKCCAMFPCLGSFDMSSEEKQVISKYYVDPDIKEKCAYPNEPISSLAIALVAVQVDNRK